MIIYKKSLLTLCLCTLISPHVFGMDKDQKRLQDFKAALDANGPKNTKQLRKTAEELSRDPKNYKRIALWTHPDLHNDEALAELFKAAAKGHEKKTKAVGITPTDVSNVRQKTEESKNLCAAMEQYSPFMAAGIETIGYGTGEVKQAFVENVISSLFTLASDKIMTRHLEGSPVIKKINSQNKNLNILSSKQKVMADKLELNSEYRSELENLKAKNDQRIQKKLRKLLNQKTS